MTAENSRGARRAPPEFSRKLLPMSSVNRIELCGQLDAPYALGDDAIAYFRKNGYVMLKHVLSPEVIADNA